MTSRNITRRQLLKMLAAGGTLILIPACRSDEPDAEALSNVGGAATAAIANTRTPDAIVAAEMPPTIEPATAAPAPTETPAPWRPPSEPRITPNPDFYTMKYHPTPPPEVDLDTYRLEVGGEVETPLSLSLTELKNDFAGHTEMRTLECISNPVGGNLMGNAVWTGLKMADLLAAAGIRSGGAQLKLESLDGYHTGIPTSLARDEHSLLVYEMNGETLPAKHGYPLRALWPGRYGQKQPKWINRITAQRRPHIGHFEGAGWSDEAIIRPNSRIEQPPARELQNSDFYVAGVAYTTDDGLEKVEVSLDDGATWQEAEILRGPSPRVWTHWWIYITGMGAGAHRTMARVTDNRGERQSFPDRNSSLLDGAFPNGTDEMHRIVVQVKS